MKAQTYAQNITTARSRFWALNVILADQASGCGVNTTAEFEAAKAAALAEGEDDRRSRRPATRPPVLCDTTPKPFGGSYTDCF
jgi:hypothetical protein